MPKTSPPRPARTALPGPRGSDGPHARSGPLALPEIPDRQHLLEHLLDDPQLAQLVPRLPPELLHEVIRQRGLEACGELVAAATPAQLASLLDLDLWRPARAGQDEQLDADRFGLWLDVLLESGPSGAAQRIAAIDVDLVVAALARHVRVFDRAAVVPAQADGEESAEARWLRDRLSCDIGGYLMVATRTDAWDAIVAVIIALDAERPDFFHRLMRGCRSLSNSIPEIDGLDDLLSEGDQVMFNVASARDRRRDPQGYVTPAQARAFLRMARQLRLTHDAAPPASPVAQAYFQAMAPALAADRTNGPSRVPAKLAAPQDAGAVPDAQDSAVPTGPPRRLLDGFEEPASRLPLIQAYMEYAWDRDSAAHAVRGQELGFLANTLIAGCSLQGRTFTALEASEASVAVCNLGLENWPRRWLGAGAGGSAPKDPGAVLPEDFLVRCDLVSVFQVGWTVLHQQVGLYAAERLIKALTGLPCADRETRAGLKDLRIALARHWKAGAPWLARDALDVIAILDTPAWVVLLGLIAECPVIPAAMAASGGSRLRAVSASAFEFISQNRQIASIGEYLDTLPGTLRG